MVKKILIILTIIILAALLIVSAIFINSKTQEYIQGEANNALNLVENNLEQESNEIVLEEDNQEEPLVTESSDLTLESFNELVLNSKGKVLVDFYAEWCGPCHYLSPVLEEIDSERDDIIVYKVNVEEQETLANQYHIYYLPTVIMFEDGEVKDQFSGAMPKDEVLDFITQ